MPKNQAEWNIPEDLYIEIHRNFMCGDLNRKGPRSCEALFDPIKAFWLVLIQSEATGLQNSFAGAPDSKGNVTVAVLNVIGERLREKKTVVCVIKPVGYLERQR